MADKAKKGGKVSSLLLIVILIIANIVFLYLYLGSKQQSSGVIPVVQDDTEQKIAECVVKYSEPFFLANLNNNINLCNQADDPGYCTDFFHIVRAIRSINMEDCNNIASSQMNSVCKGIFSRDLNSCNVFDSDDDLYYCNAVVGQDSSFCNPIVDQVEKSSCREDSLLINALRENNAQVCETHEDSAFVAYCQALVTGNKQIYTDKMRLLCATLPAPPE